MRLVKTSLLATIIGGLIIHSAVASETATVHGIEITVSGSKSTEERFKGIAQQHADEREKNTAKERRIQNKVDNAGRGPLKPYVMGLNY